MNSLLKSLLTWLCFAGTAFFAAGAVVDAGAGDGGIDDGADSSIGSAEDAGTSEDTSGGTREANDDAATDGVSGGSETSGDSRTLPKNIQAALKTLKEAHPELAKDIEELRKGYFGHRQHSEFFKSPTEARQAKATLDLIGGAEGISELQTKVAAVEAIDSSLEQGDPQVISDIATDFPEGFKKLAGPYFEKLQQMDPAAAAKVLQPHAFALMEHAGLGPVLDAIGQAIAANDLPKAKDLLGKSLAWYEGQKQQAGTRQKTDDPERAKLAQDRQKFESEKEGSFRQDIGRQTLTHQRDEVNKALAPYLKTKALTAEERADITAGMNSRVNALLKADGTYQAQMKALLTARNRDPEKIIQYVKAAVSEAARTAVRARYGKAPAAKAVTTTTTANKDKTVANPAASGPIKIAAKPNRADVDWSKTKDILFITNKAVMKNGPYKGKMVTWK